MNNNYKRYKIDYINESKGGNAAARRRRKMFKEREENYHMPTPEQPPIKVERINLLRKIPGDIEREPPLDKKYEELKKQTIDNFSFLGKSRHKMGLTSEKDSKKLNTIQKQYWKYRDILVNNVLKRIDDEYEKKKQLVLYSSCRKDCSNRPTVPNCVDECYHRNDYRHYLNRKEKSFVEATRLVKEWEKEIEKEIEREKEWKLYIEMIKKEGKEPMSRTKWVNDIEKEEEWKSYIEKVKKEGKEPMSRESWDNEKENEAEKERLWKSYFASSTLKGKEPVTKEKWGQKYDQLKKKKEMENELKKRNRLNIGTLRG